MYFASRIVISYVAIGCLRALEAGLGHSSIATSDHQQVGAALRASTFIQHWKGEDLALALTITALVAPARQMAQSFGLEECLLRRCEQEVSAAIMAT